MWKSKIYIQLEKVVHLLHGIETIFYLKKTKLAPISFHNNKFGIGKIFKYIKKK